MTVWLVRIWTHKNADEKAHTLSRRSKNVKKRTKTYEKRILCKFTLTSFPIRPIETYLAAKKTVQKAATKMILIQNSNNVHMYTFCYIFAF